ARLGRHVNMYLAAVLRPYDLGQRAGVADEGVRLGVAALRGLAPEVAGEAKQMVPLGVSVASAHRSSKVITVSFSPRWYWTGASSHHSGESSRSARHFT